MPRRTALPPRSIAPRCRRKNVLRGNRDKQEGYQVWRKEPWEGFSDFVEKTFRALVKKEEEVSGVGNSDFRVFCRLDVVAFREKNKRLSFFAKGVRGMGAELFLGQSDTAEKVKFPKDIAIALRTWVAIRRSLKEAGEQSADM